MSEIDSFHTREIIHCKVYVLYINLRKSISISVGRLGKISFKKGGYLYIGSAKKGIINRLNRHLRKSKKIFWHIDYLLSQNSSKINKIWVADNIRECNLAKRIRQFIQVEQIKGFGCSDCRCLSHLLYYDGKKDRLSCLAKKLKLINCYSEYI